jgi:sugar transferase (PEP-CTERM/EpsH1 system associated)
MNKIPPLIVHIIFKLSVGGLENGLINLINNIPKKKYRHAIICLTISTDFSQRLERKDVQIYELNKREGKDWNTFFRLYKLLITIKPDIVHTRNLVAIEYQLSAFFSGVKHRVHSEHGWDIFDPDGLIIKYQWLRRLLNPFIQRFIPLSKQLQSYLITKVKIPEKKIIRICNGVDTQIFHPRLSSRRHLMECPFSFDRDEIYIGTVGRMHGVKDQLTLINAFIKLIDYSPEIKQITRLIVVGEGPLRAEALNILRDKNLDKYVWLPGKRDDVDEIMRHLDIFVLPSQAEGISNTILEAMATGLPVIATSVGGNPELVQEGVTGCLVEKSDSTAMANELLEYVRNKEKREQHGLNAYQLVKKEFSLDIMVNRYVDVYDSLIYGKN